MVEQKQINPESTKPERDIRVDIKPAVNIYNFNPFTVGKIVSEEDLRRRLEEVPEKSSKKS